ncbi:MAG: cation transporter [Bacteroidetes bacterium]|jgi:cation diffusion facilitator family transporter|nr:cation transporter [Bacteroidota bacterium]PTM15765.1 MAG: cation transporter [Bacteroidota bacterium]PTM20910.1 MAG: cation transporter [Bacteroidota bacterium]
MKKHNKAVRRALLISLSVSLISLSIKLAAFFTTHSVAALSDAAESVVHVFAVAFVVYGYYLSLRPADEKHPFGYERIEFLSVGAEGSIIIAAGFTILYQTVMSMISGAEIQNMETGIGMLAAAAGINAILGTYVLRVGRREKSMIAVSNGKHTLTDVWTSVGVVTVLVLIHFTGWVFMDIVVSFAVAIYIMWEAYKLLRYSLRGIMDVRDPEADKALRNILQKEKEKGELFVDWHHLRHRTSGNTTWVQLHLVFPDGMSLKESHEKATVVERMMIDALDSDAVINIHLEPHESHESAHKILEGANKRTSLKDYI